MKKKILMIILSLLFAFSVCTPAFAEDENTAKEIKTVEDLKGIVNDLNGNYVLMNDIDLSGETWTSIGTENEPFEGNFDGNGHTISNLVQDVKPNAETSYSGLFGSVKNSVIKNLSIKNADISINGTVKEGCYSGIVSGMCDSSEVKNCRAEGKIKFSVNGNFIAGGIVGYARETDINKCGNFAEIKGSICDGICSVGGIVGTASKNISECGNYASISASITTDKNSYSGGYIGGICGSSGGNIENCHNDGSVNGRSNKNYECTTGGICGFWHSGSYIKSSLNTATVTDGSSDVENDCNAIVGYYEFVGIDEIPEYEIKNCYYSDIVTDDYKDTTALTNEQMKNKDNFEGFDFENIWDMGEEHPVLKNFKTEDKTPDTPDVPDTPDTPDVPDENEKKLVSAKIIWVPLKNRITFSNGSPASPKSIIVKLDFSDGSSAKGKIMQSDNGYEVNGISVSAAIRPAVVEYGILTDTLYIGEENIAVSYKYVSVPNIFSILGNLFG